MRACPSSYPRIATIGRASSPSTPNRSGRTRAPLRPKESAATAGRFADQAIDALKQAVDGGFRKRIALKNGWIWNPLRTRDDFRALIQKLEDEAKADPIEGEVKPGEKTSPG